jgi:hypothetical protein
MNFKNVPIKNWMAFLAVVVVLVGTIFIPVLWWIVLSITVIGGVVFLVKGKISNRLFSDSVETIKVEPEIKTEPELEVVKEETEKTETKSTPEPKQPKKSNKNKFLFGGAVLAMILGSFAGGFLLAGLFNEPIETVIEKTVVQTVEVPVTAAPVPVITEPEVTTSSAFAEEVAYDSYEYESYGQGGGEAAQTPIAPITPVAPAIEVIETPSAPIELVPDETIPVEPETPVTPTVKPVVKILFDGFPIIYVGETYNIFATILAEQFEFVQSDVTVSDEAVLSAEAEEAEGGIDVAITGLEVGEASIQLPEGMVVDNGEESDASNILNVRVVEAPVEEEPAVEEPVVEEPIIDEPVVEEPVDEPVVEEPVDTPVVNEPVEEPVDDTPEVIETPSEDIQLPEVPSSDQSSDDIVFE